MGRGLGRRIKRTPLALLLWLTRGQAWYRTLSRGSGCEEVRYWNFGYSNNSVLGPTLQDDEKPDRTHISLYLAAVEGTDLRGKRILEVGCGLGAGAEALIHYKSPGSIIALDRYQQSSWTDQNETTIGFLQADAVQLPFANDSFDLLLSVEAAHSFPSYRSFLAQAFRVLIHSGELHLADLHTQKEGAHLQQEIQQAGFNILAWENLTPGVLRAIELEADRRLDIMRPMVSGLVPRFLQPLALSLVQQGRVRLTRAFREGELTYSHFRACKCP